MIATVQVNSAGQFEIVGEINFNTVPALHRRGCELIAASPRPIFDLQQVAYSDNSGVALLISLVRCARNVGKAVVFVNISQQFSDIIRMSGLDEILPIE